MDGKGCWRDNIFIERLWKTIKYEEVYLRAYGSVSEARIRLAKYIDFYNRRRPHKAIGRVSLTALMAPPMSALMAPPEGSFFTLQTG